MTKNLITKPAMLRPYSDVLPNFPLLVSGVTFGETDHNLTILYMENILYQYACET